MTQARWEDAPAIRRIRIEGDLDHLGCENVGSAVREAVAECSARRVVIDLSAVTFITSKGLSLLIEARKRVVATGRSLVIEGLAPQVRRALDTIGFVAAYPECVGIRVS